MKKIGIIGCGFAGTMTAVQIINKSNVPCEIIVIDKQEKLNRGIAYSTSSPKHLLNVIAGKMSAFPENSNHFLEWVMAINEFKNQDKALVTNSFLPRKLYGQYLETIWKDAVALASAKNIKLKVIHDNVTELNISGNGFTIGFNNKTKIEIDQCVLATGNQIPRNPNISNQSFYTSKNYFQNPWQNESVKNTDDNFPILIIGNGLTMVDSVLALLENGFKNEIYSISPNGFNILPHRSTTLKYSKLVEELNEHLSLFDLVKLVNKHLKKAKSIGIPTETVIDSLRPYTQMIWKNLSEKEKLIFMSRLRHLWGVARHRIPMQTYNQLQQLRSENKLHIKSGKIIGFTEFQENIIVEYFDKKEAYTKKIPVSRIINCTGPETDLMNLGENFLKNCLLNGILKQDNLKLGISTNTETFEVIAANGKANPNLFTIGSNLKGELWESTAVNEIRIQAEKLAVQIMGN